MVCKLNRAMYDLKINIWSIQSNLWINLQKKKSTKKRKEKSITDIHLNKMSIFGCCYFKEDSNWCELYNRRKDIKKSTLLYVSLGHRMSFIFIYLSIRFVFQFRNPPYNVSQEAKLPRDQVWFASNALISSLGTLFTKDTAWWKRALGQKRSGWWKIVRRTMGMVGKRTV